MRMSSCLSVYNYIYWMFDFWCSCFGLRKSSETKLFMLERAGGPHDFSWLWPTSVKLSLSVLKLQNVMPCNCHFFFQAFISSLSVKVLGVWAWVCMQGQGDDPYRFLLILICYCYSVNIDKFRIFFQTVVSWCSRWPSLQGQQILLVDWVPSPVFMKCTLIIYLPILTCYIFRSKVEHVLIMVSMVPGLAQDNLRRPKADGPNSYSHFNVLRAKARAHFLSYAPA